MLTVREVLEELLSRGWFGKTKHGNFFDKREDIDRDVDTALKTLQSLILGAVPKKKVISNNPTKIMAQIGWLGWNECRTETKSNLAKLFR